MLSCVLASLLQLDVLLSFLAVARGSSLDGLMAGILDSAFPHACSTREMPLLVQNSKSGRPLLICQESPCLRDANVTCTVASAPCEAEGEWMRAWDGLGGFVCCKSASVRRSSLVRAAPLLPGHTAVLRGFQETLHLPSTPSPSHWQFGEALTSLALKRGVLVMGVARFKCGSALGESGGPGAGSDYPDYYGSMGDGKRGKRAAYLTEPLDKPACDSEWASETISSLAGEREGTSLGSALSKITDVSYCGVETTQSESVSLVF